MARRGKALSGGNKELSEVLDKLYQDTKKLNRLFEEAVRAASAREGEKQSL